MRLLETGEIIDKDDEMLDDNCTDWLPVDRWVIGKHYCSGAFVPMRRAYELISEPET